MAMLTRSVTTILITGHRGFIGKRLIDRFKSSAPSFKILLYPGDLLNRDDLTKFFAAQQPIHAVVHLAGTFDGDFDTLLKKNVVTTHNLLNTSAEFGVSSFIYASSGAVYGESAPDRPCKEDDPRLPNTLYGLCKKMAEDLVFYFHRSHGLRTIILRFPHVYGESNDKGVLYHFLQGIRTQGKITVYGDGMQSRQFLHVEDACDALEKSLLYRDAGVFNISNPRAFTIREVIDCLKQKKSFGVEYKATNNFLQHLLLDTSKAEKTLGFRAQFTELKLPL